MEENEERGIALLRRAAEKGDIKAIGNLAPMLAKTALENDDHIALEEAIKWYEKLPFDPKLEGLLDMMISRRR